MVIYLWFLYAALSSIFASLMTIFMKIGLKNLDSLLVTALRTTIVFGLLWIIVIVMHKNKGIMTITNREWIYIFLSALFTCGTWVFYFLALKETDVSKVLAIDRLSIVLTVFLSVVILKEKINLMTIAGIIVLIGGTLLIVFN